MLSTAYWIFEYIKVLFGYLFLMFLWPHIVFAGHLKKKSPIYRFGFCAAVQTTLVNTVVLGLGLIHILNQWTVCAIFWGVPLIVVWRRVSKMEIDSKSFFHVVLISRGKILLQRAAVARWKKLKALWHSHLHLHIWEYLALAAICVYSLIYFSWGSFQTICYGFGDMYVHHSWIYGLIEGKPFSAGVYPEAMHCMIYTIHTVLGVRVFSLMLFFGSIQGTVFLLASYCLLREFFCCRYTPIFAVAAFLLLYTESWRELDGMARLQWTLPLEFGLAMQMLCVLFLIRYLKSTRTENGKKSCFFYDHNLFVFAMSLSATISAHFYPLIVAFFMCLGITAFHLKKIFSKERFVPLVVAVLGGLVISVLPMAVSLASGNHLQGSMRWAMNVVNGKTSESREELSGSEEDQSPTPGLEQEPGSEQKHSVAISIKRLIQRGFDELVGENKGGFLSVLTAAIILVCLVLRLTERYLPPSLQERIKTSGADRLWFSKYPQLLMMELFLFLLYIAPYLGLPELVLGVRLASTERILIFAIGAIPLDFLLSLILLIKESIPQILSIACLAVLCIWGTTERNYHGYLYCELTRYRAEVSVLSELTREYPQHQYTIISPTDGLYHVIEYGRHEELVLFIQQVAEERYFLPTEHVFVFVEKHPLKYAQRYYFSGPSWLARERNNQPSTVSASEISKEASQSKASLPLVFQSYTNLETRTIIESKAYYWCKKFAKLYPYEMNVYYEDDDFICYHFEQETHSPFNLAIDYEDFDE